LNLLLQNYNEYNWLAPYGYAIVLLGFVFYLFRVFENFYANQFNKPLFRNYLVYKKLSKGQLVILQQEFSFYNQLSFRHKRQFEHRIASFISDKEFIGRENLQVTERMKVLVSSVVCMISVGRKNYGFSLIDFILLYPDEFYSKINDAFHKGEFNPKSRVLVLSWKDFENGYQITNDNRNLGIHEYMHAMHLESIQGSDYDSDRFIRQFQNILKQLTKPEIKDKLIDTKYFREYAFTNQYEFMAVITEYFFESPEEFKSQFPDLYEYTKKILNFNFLGY
jgi:Mlc titration factor MtfA (ptsG expression regulator)